MALNNRHTIVLVQYTTSASSRTYYDFESVHDASEGVCRMFEQSLQQQQPNVTQISYDVAELLTWIDQGVVDLTCLVFDPRTGSYAPFPKDWIKNRVLEYMRHLGA